MEKLSERRERGLNDLAAVIEEIWGKRCSRNEGGCASCLAWGIFDAMERLTDASSLACAEGVDEERAVG